MAKKQYLDIIERVIYVIKLEDGCFYVGQAQKKSFKRRMKEHFEIRKKVKKISMG